MFKYESSKECITFACRYRLLFCWIEFAEIFYLFISKYCNLIVIYLAMFVQAFIKETNICNHCFINLYDVLPLDIPAMWLVIFSPITWPVDVGQPTIDQSNNMECKDLYHEGYFRYQNYHYWFLVLLLVSAWWGGSSSSSSSRSSSSSGSSRSGMTSPFRNVIIQNLWTLYFCSFCN